MQSEIQIVNSALAKLGEEPLLSIYDNNKAARFMGVQYQESRDALMREHLWSFAMKRAYIASNGVVPAFQFGLTFPKPIDCLRVAFVGQYYVGASLTDFRASDESGYAVEGSAIVSDLADPLPIRYVRRVTDPAFFDASFAEALALQLAFDACEAITQSDDDKDMIGQELRTSLKTAVTLNAIEKPPQPLPDDSWIIARLQ